MLKLMYFFLFVLLSPLLSPISMSWSEDLADLLQVEIPTDNVPMKGINKIYETCRGPFLLNLLVALGHEGSTDEIKMQASLSYQVSDYGALDRVFSLGGLVDGEQVILFSEIIREGKSKPLYAIQYQGTVYHFEGAFPRLSGVESVAAHFIAEAGLNSAPVPKHTGPVPNDRLMKVGGYQEVYDKKDYASGPLVDQSTYRTTLTRIETLYNIDVMTSCFSSEEFNIRSGTPNEERLERATEVLTSVIRIFNDSVNEPENPSPASAVADHQQKEVEDSTAAPILPNSTSTTAAEPAF